jgi:hypothetical protein
MPNEKVAIAILVEPKLKAKLIAVARSRSRSLSNFLELDLKSRYQNVTDEDLSDFSEQEKTLAASEIVAQPVAIQIDPWEQYQKEGDAR